jgi:hypothetical protein
VPSVWAGNEVQETGLDKKNRELGALGNLRLGALSQGEAAIQPYLIFAR